MGQQFLNTSANRLFQGANFPKSCMKPRDITRCPAHYQPSLCLPLGAVSQEHLTNTLRQGLILEALGFQMPTYAHCSLILGEGQAGPPSTRV